MSDIKNNGLVTFIRIPKNASTSIYSFFGSKNTIRNELLCADNDMYLNVFESSHCNIADAVKFLGDEVLNNPVLAVTRNPFDRLVSMFFFARKHNLGILYDVNTNDFDSFARDFYKLSGDRNFFHAMPQSEYISHDKSDGFTVIRFEELKEGICSFIIDNCLEEFFNKDELPNLNGTIHNHYSDYYSSKSKGIVSDMWGCDLDNFGYSFNQ